MAMLGRQAGRSWARRLLSSHGPTAGVANDASPAAFLQYPQAELSTLKNGVRVVSEVWRVRRVAANGRTHLNVGRRQRSIPELS